MDVCCLRPLDRPPPSMGSIFRGLLWLGESFPDTEMK
jgi:hypothetical protein